MAKFFLTQSLTSHSSKKFISYINSVNFRIDHFVRLIHFKSEFDAIKLETTKEEEEKEEKMAKEEEEEVTDIQGRPYLWLFKHSSVKISNEIRYEIVNKM